MVGLRAKRTRRVGFYTLPLFLTKEIFIVVFKMSRGLLFFASFPSMGEDSRIPHQRQFLFLTLMIGLRAKAQSLKTRRRNESKKYCSTACARRSTGS